MIEYKVGSIFNSTADTLVCPVNTVGVMGAGLALRFAERWPVLRSRHKYLCRSGDIRIGSPYLAACTTYPPTMPHVLFFPTKGDWRKPSQLWYIRKGLEWIAYNHLVLADRGVKLVAFPRLGCGLGGLKWDNVQDLMISYLGSLTFGVEIWTPEHIEAALALARELSEGE